MTGFSTRCKLKADASRFECSRAEVLISDRKTVSAQVIEGLD
jgi:hypothetical protein